MKREIKFRAWDIENEKMMYPKNGYFVRDSGTRFMVSADGKCIPVYLEESVVVKPILEQYTGLKDRNGVDIYEGDILKFFLSSSAKWNNQTVYFTKGSFMVSASILYDVLKRGGSFEVINNIHQNKYQ